MRGSDAGQKSAYEEYARHEEMMKAIDHDHASFKKKV
jgi:hypothetical protein